MSRARNILGIIAAVILLLSSVAHSLMGWPAIRAKLAESNVPADLVFGLQIGWQFGGVCMVVFAVILFSLFMRRLRGEAVSTLPALAIGIAYVVFGAWALMSSKDPFFLIFIVPGVLLLIAGTGSRVRLSS